MFTLHLARMDPTPPEIVYTTGFQSVLNSSWIHLGEKRSCFLIVGGQLNSPWWINGVHDNRAFPTLWQQFGGGGGLLPSHECTKQDQWQDMVGLESNLTSIPPRAFGSQSAARFWNLVERALWKTGGSCSSILMIMVSEWDIQQTRGLQFLGCLHTCLPCLFIKPG